MRYSALRMCHQKSLRGFPGNSDDKESACNAGDLGLISELRRSPGEGHGYPLQPSCLGNPMDREAWRATSMGHRRVRHGLVTKKQQQTFPFKS